jgi:DNA-binding IclR family transcriptional regulator
MLAPTFNAVEPPDLKSRLAEIVVRLRAGAHHRAMTRPVGQAEAKAGPQAVQRAVAILGVFSEGEPELSLKSISARTGLPVSTAYRLAQALQHSGLLERSDDGRSYRIGTGLVALTAPALHRLNVQTLAPQLHSLAADIEITASFGIAEADDMFTVFSARPVTRFCGHQLPGSRQSLAHSAMGMAVLAFKRRPTEPALELVRRRGYADASGRQGDHVRAIAVPVMGGDGDAWGAVGVQALRRRMTDDLVHEMLPVIRRHAHRIARPDSIRRDIPSP